MSSEPDEDEEPLNLVLARYRSYNEIGDYPSGSRVTRAHCGHLVWVSQQSQGVVDAGHWDGRLIRTHCLPCAATDVRLAQKKGELLGMPGAIEAMRKHAQGRGKQEQVEAFIRRFGLREVEGPRGPQGGKSDE